MKHSLGAGLISAMLIVLLVSGAVGALPVAYAAGREAAIAVPVSSEQSFVAVISQAGTVVELVPELAPTPPSKRLARFEEASGAFSVRYPADLRRIRQLDAPDIYGYMFTNEDETVAFAVGFLGASASGLSDSEWQVIFLVLRPDELMRKLGSVFDDYFVEVTREPGARGVHRLYWEAETEEAEAYEELRHYALLVEESAGILALTAVVAPLDEWETRRELFVEALNSLEWSPEDVRTQVAGVEETSGETAEPEEVAGEEIGEPTETPEEGGVEIAPEIIIESLLPEATEEAETPAVSETPEVSEEVDVITPEEPTTEEAAEEVTPGVETITFEDPDGVFVLTYPAMFDTPEGPQVDEDGYVYAVSISGSEIHFLGVYFQIVAEEGFSDAQWKATIDPVVEVMLEQAGEDAVEVYRETGKRDQHWVYIEAESEVEKTRMFFYVEEASGVLAVLLARVPLEEWSDWEGALLDVVHSFRWWPSTAREVLSSTPAKPSPTFTPAESSLRSTPTPPSVQPAIPAGKGGLIMLNCRGDVVTVDIIPDAIFQELAPKTGDQCYRGAPIFLDPGEHILKASVAGRPSQGEATITIVAGQWFEFTWY